MAQGTARVNPVIVRSRVAKKRSGTLRTASLPVDDVADCSSARDVRCNRRSTNGQYRSGRDVVPNVPDLFGGIGVRAVGADVAQGTARVNPVILRSRVAKKRSGTLRTASLRDSAADCSSASGYWCTAFLNTSQQPLPGGTLSPTSLIFSAALTFERLGRISARDPESQPGYCSFVRREENKWDLGATSWTASTPVMAVTALPRRDVPACLDTANLPGRLTKPLRTGFSRTYAHFSA